MALAHLRADPTAPIGDALLEQRNLAGVGNVFKSEICFLGGVHPLTPVGAVPDLPGIVDKSKQLLEVNKDRPTRITTGDKRRGYQLWVYGRRGPCLRCGTPIQKADQGPPGQQRPTYWCPRLPTALSRWLRSERSERLETTPAAVLRRRASRSSRNWRTCDERAALRRRALDPDPGIARITSGARCAGTSTRPWVSALAARWHGSWARSRARASRSSERSRVNSSTWPVGTGSPATGWCSSWPTLQTTRPSSAPGRTPSSRGFEAGSYRALVIGTRLHVRCHEPDPEVDPSSGARLRIAVGLRSLVSSDRSLLDHLWLGPPVRGVTWSQIGFAA